MGMFWKCGENMLIIHGLILLLYREWSNQRKFIKISYWTHCSHMMTSRQQIIVPVLNKQYIPVKKEKPVELLVGICMHFTEQHSPSMRWKWSHSGLEHCITAQATAMPPSHRQVRHGSSGTKYAPTVIKRPRRSWHASAAPGWKSTQTIMLDYKLRP